MTDKVRSGRKKRMAPGAKFGSSVTDDSAKVVQPYARREAAPNLNRSRLFLEPADGGSLSKESKRFSGYGRRLDRRMNHYQLGNSVPVNPECIARRLLH